MEAMRVLVILFLLTVGRTPADRHEFDRIKGDTCEVRGNKMKLYMMDSNGKALPRKPGFALGAHGILFRLERTPNRGGR